METHVYLAVLGAAILHAGWNTLVKVGSDRLSILVLMSLVQAAIGASLLAFVPAPTADAVPWIATAAVLHTGYKVFLSRAYALADLSQAYPLARGTAPLIVFLLSVLVFAKAFKPIETAAVLAISTGILLMAVKGGRGGRMDGKALAYAIGTAAFIAGYTTAGGIGARIAGTPSGFLFWVVIGDSAGMAAYALAHRGRTAFSALIPVWKSGVFVGAISLGAYWIVMWAFTVAPIALVAALRETSILFATVLAALLIRERVSAWRWVSASCIALGAILMKL